MNTTMKRQNSTSSLLLVEDDLDSSEDIFDPPAWRPGRFLQFADICLEDEPSVRPVSLYTDRTLLGPEDSADDSPSQGTTSTSSFIVELDAGSLSSRHMRLSRRTKLVMTSCVAMAFTALTVLTFVI